MKLILTGATGMVGEGVLLECLDNSSVTQLLLIGRKHYEFRHAKLTELLVPDFLKINDFANQMTGYDACFYCAGISSVGMNETDYSRITYDTTIIFAKTVLKQNPDIVFNYITGRSTDSTEKGRSMWARVKGRTENELMRLGFKGQYNFRPGVMLSSAGQKNAKAIYTFIAKLIRLFSPQSVLTIKELGRAMINAVLKGYSKQVLEIEDIKILAVSA